jgi:hypothetical protein
MASSRRKNKPITDVTRLVENHIEEHNYLLFTIADRNPLQIKELNTWSVEGWYQFLYANNIHARKLEAQQKTQTNRKNV